MKLCRTTARLLATFVICLALSGCFFLPGKFTAHLDLRRDGTFTYRYTGELLFAHPDMERFEEYRAPMETDNSCELDDPDLAGGASTACSTQNEALRAAELAGLAARQAQAAEFASIAGYNPYDRAANEEIASHLTDYPGWKHAAYKGAGVFDVVYEILGTLDREMTFPILPQAQFSFPILTIRRTNGNRVEIEAPGMAPDRLRRQVIRISGDDDGFPLFNRARGTFTITTDAEVTDTDGTLQSESGLRTIGWNVDGMLTQTPRLQVSLKK